jgi:putative transcriptional regulator
MKNTISIEREFQKMTQEKLAKSVNVSRQSISSIESNRFMPSVMLSLKIAKVLNKKVEELFLLEEFD